MEKKVQKKVERKEPTVRVFPSRIPIPTPPQGAFADLLKASREFAASSSTPLPVIQDLTTKPSPPPKKHKSLLGDIVPPSRSPLAGYTIDSLATMSEDEVTILFTFWEEWENARLARIRARREFEQSRDEMDDNLRTALQREWDAMGPEPDILGYNDLPDDSDRFAAEHESERYALYHKKVSVSLNLMIGSTD